MSIIKKAFPKDISKRKAFDWLRTAYILASHAYLI